MDRLGVGQEVYAFYHANEHPEGYRYGYVCERKGEFPVIGLTSGWLPATVVEEVEPDSLAEGNGRVRVWFHGTFRDPYESYCECMELSVPVALVRDLRATHALPEPLVSIVALRWHDYWSNMRWSDYSITNDGFFVDLFDGPCSVHERLLGEFEVYTVFVRGTEDLDMVDPSKLRARLRGRSVTAWYFVWPSVRQEADHHSGCVCERRFFAFCARAERASLRSGWPHAAHLYRLLCGKLWVPQMCLHKEYHVPPTTRVHYAEFKAHRRKAAARALDGLMRLRKLIWSREPVAPEAFRGVVKLGFSWQGDDVLPFQGLASLVNNLARLFEQHHSEQTVCLVQEMVPGVVGEHRILCFRDKLGASYRREAIWLRMKGRGKHHVHRCDLGEFALASSSVVPSESVASELFEGDAAAQLAAESEAQRLVDRWLVWFQTECTEPPQVTRIDFLVAHRSGLDTSSTTGAADVWTCEVGECGASLCSVEVDLRNAASLNAALLHDDSGRFPACLPEAVLRNSGWKS